MTGQISRPPSISTVPTNSTTGSLIPLKDNPILRKSGVYGQGMPVMFIPPTVCVMVL